METLNKIFGDRVRVRIMRLFLLNPEKTYTKNQIIATARGSRGMVEKEIAAFMRAGLIKQKKISGYQKKRKPLSVGWTLNSTFIYLPQLQSLVANGVLLKNKDVMNRLQRAGNMKLITLSGVFLQDWSSRIDLLVVGDRFNKDVLSRSIRSIESDIGRELQYTVLDTTDFQYRLSVGDKLLRDVFDFPHQVVLNKLHVAK